MSNLFKVNFKDVGMSILNGVFIAVVGYLANLTNVLAVDPNQLLNVAIIAALGTLLKTFTSDSQGRVFGKIG